jgi:hypothetical protein
VRLASLARLIPALVHRANNSLAIMRGACDLVRSPSHAEHLERAARETDLLAQLLARLSLCAKTHPPVYGLFDVGAMTTGVGEFLAVLLEKGVVEWKVPREGGAPLLALGDSLRLEQLLIWLAAEAAQSPREGSRKGPGRIRLSLVRAGVDGDQIRLTLLFQGASRDLMPWSDEALEACREFAASRGMRLDLASRFGGLSIARFRLPAHASSPVPAPAPVAGRGEGRAGVGERPRRILLLEEDELQRDLIRDVLVESGYEVHIPGGVDLEASLPEEFDLLLFDADAERKQPGLLDRLLTVLGGLPPSRVAVLGDLGARSGGPAPMPCIAKPFRPGELLELVAKGLA